MEPNYITNVELFLAYRNYQREDCHDFNVASLGRPTKSIYDEVPQKPYDLAWHEVARQKAGEIGNGSKEQTLFARNGTEAAHYISSLEELKNAKPLSVYNSDEYEIKNHIFKVLFN